MAPNYFVCRPGELCDGAACCTSPETRPSLLLGDYIRLSEHTGEPLEKIWREKGDVSLSKFGNMGPTEFLVTLGLLHDPCPYLAHDYRCGVYESRPLGCGSFPFPLLTENQEEAKTRYGAYRCLDGVEPSPNQIEYAKELHRIMREEAVQDMRILWNGRPRYIQIPTERWEKLTRRHDLVQIA